MEESMESVINVINVDGFGQASDVVTLPLESESDQREGFRAAPQQREPKIILEMVAG